MSPGSFLGTLDRKLLRDLARIWSQSLAIALVMACGVATLIIALGAYRALEETRSAFYDRYRFAHVFASVTRAPLNLRATIAGLDGVSGVELRIVRPAVLDMQGMAEPATGIVVSTPDVGEPAVNRLYIRSGRLPSAARRGEVAVSESFAKAHRMEPGSTFSALIDGRKQTLTVTGIVLSPEYIYALAPGDMVPDQRRFGVFFMPRTVLAGIAEMDGAFNDVVVRVRRDAKPAQIIDALDDLLRPYGGRGAYERADQMSHAFLDNELVQLRASAIVVPPIFLFVSAFLVNMILSRMIALEREQIGLLKALGYGRAAIAGHYAKLVVLICLCGVLLGFAAGNWLGFGLTRLYARFFSFPFLIFPQNADLYLISAGITVAAALAGAARAIWSVVALPAAVAMRAPAPTRYRSVLAGGRLLHLLFSQLTIMALRHLFRWPGRSALTTLGTSLSVALLVTALFSFDSVDFMVDTVFSRTERQHATLTFGNDRSPRALQSVEKLPGVLRAEPFRATAVKLRNKNHERRMSILGLPARTDLQRILDMDLQPVRLPERGLLISERVADVLKLGLGDRVEVGLLEHGGRSVFVPVTSIVQSYVGLTAVMELGALDRLIGDGRRISGAYLLADSSELETLYRAVKETPAIAGIALKEISRSRFRETIGENISIMMSVYVGLAAIITFGVVYNSARIQYSERAREFASLRVLGFTRAEVSAVLVIELALIVLAAQPLGWLLGYGFAWLVVEGSQSDLFRIPFVIETSTFAVASLVVLGVAAVSVLFVQQRVNRLDMVRVLKTRE